MMKFGEGNNVGERQTDLRGQAVLDAMGLLDEVESAQFERAFRDAPPSVQADLRAVQAAVAVEPAFLADGEPSPDLRLKTLARVMTAVEQQEVQFAPIAHIGRTAARAERHPVRSIDASELVEQAMELSALRKDVERFTRSSYYWRAAAIALTAALTVALVFQVTTSQLALRITQYALGSATPAQVFQAMGHPGAVRFFEKASFIRGVAGSDGSASIAVDLASRKSLMVAIGLTAGSQYVLQHRSDTGFKTELASFVAQRGIWGVEFEKGAELLDTGTLVLLDDAGNVVMTS
jgi:hypothetical protein